LVGASRILWRKGEFEVPRKIKRYKAMGFGDRDDTGSVEAHLRTKAEAAETRRYNRQMRLLEAEEAKGNSGGFFSKLLQLLTGFLSKKWR
jgi:hypothetical protein